jgi:hypothetical protein
MSAIKLSSSATGAGNITLLSPVAATDKTITLPDRAGFMSVDGPSFSVYPSAATSLVQNVATKISFGNVIHDSHTCFNTSSSRFQPTVAGWYMIGGSVRVFSAYAGLSLFIYKNVVLEKEIGTSAPSNLGAIQGWAMVYLNGSTDYVELYCIQTVATQNGHSTADRTYFQGFFVRP